MTLSPEAKAILDAGREAMTPSAESKAQVLGAVEEKVAGGG